MIAGRLISFWVGWPMDSEGPSVVVVLVGIAPTLASGHRCGKGHMGEDDAAVVSVDRETSWTGGVHDCAPLSATCTQSGSQLGVIEVGASGEVSDGAADEREGLRGRGVLENT